MTAGRLLAEVVIEADDAVHFGARDVQAIGDQRHGLGRHTAQLVLHGMQDFQQRSRLVREARERLAHATLQFFDFGGHDSFWATRMRQGLQYTLHPPGRRKATSVMPADSANSTASVEGAPMAATTGQPAIMAFCSSSKLARPDSSSTRWLQGNSPASSAAPTSLSMALCRPTSSRLAINSPSAVNSPTACMPPVSAKPACDFFKVSGSPRNTDSLTISSLEIRRSPALAVTASMEALPQTPQLDVV